MKVFSYLYKWPSPPLAHIEKKVLLTPTEILKLNEIPE